jgi:mycothiol synthase
MRASHAPSAALVPQRPGLTCRHDYVLGPRLSHGRPRVSVRPLRSEDAELVAALARAEQAAVSGGSSHLEARDVELWWTACDFESDSWLVEQDGTALAAGWFVAYGELGGVSVFATRTTHGRDLAASLYERGEAAARGKSVPRIHTYVFPGDEAKTAHLLDHGYREVRRLFEMAIVLETEPEEPTLPEPLVLEPFREADARAHHAATNDAFRDLWESRATPFEEWWDSWRGQDADEHGTLWFHVRDADEIVGVIRSEMRENGGYVGIVGVRRPWRGRGIAKALLYRAFSELWRRGARRVSLGVDAESPTGATKLYESVGMSVENAVAVYEKRLA